MQPTGSSLTPIWAAAICLGRPVCVRNCYRSQGTFHLWLRVGIRQPEKHSILPDLPDPAPPLLLMNPVMYMQLPMQSAAHALSMVSKTKNSMQCPCLYPQKKN